MTSLYQYDGRTLTSIDSADLELPGGDAETPEAEPAPAGDFGKLLEAFREALGHRSNPSGPRSG